jgi:hypothetical protein
MLNFLKKSESSGLETLKKRKTEEPTRKSAAWSVDESDWNLKHGIKSVEDVSVVVHTSKVRQVRAWLSNAVQYHGDFGHSPGFRPCMLALCGSSGSCKSSMTQVLCADLGIKVVEWSDDLWQSDVKSSYDRPSSMLSLNYAREQGNGWAHNNDYKSVMQQKKDEFHDFVVASSYTPLDFSVHNSVSKNSGIEVGRMNKRAGNTDDPLYLKENQGESITTMGPIVKPHILLVHDTPESMAKSKVNDSTVNSDEFLDFLIEFRVPVVFIVSDVNEREDFQRASSMVLPPKLRSCVNYESLFCPGITEKKITKYLGKIVASEAKQKSLSSQEIKKYLSLAGDLASSCMGDLRHAITQLQFSWQSSTGKLKGESPTLPANMDNQMSSSIKRRDKRLSPLHAVGKLLTARLDKMSLPTGFESTEMSIAEAINANKSTQKTEGKDGDYLHKFSTMQGVSPDDVIEHSDLPLDIFVSFLQFNCLAHLMSSSRLTSIAQEIMRDTQCENDKVVDSTDYNRDVASESASDNALLNIDNVENVEMSKSDCVLEQIVMALDYFSDTELLMSRQYDTSSNLVFGNTFFPSVFIKALSSRATMVARGPAAHEAREKARSAGMKFAMISSHRPKTLDLWNEQRQLRNKFMHLRYSTQHRSSLPVALVGRSNGIDKYPCALSFSELVTTSLPFLNPILGYDTSSKNKDGDTKLLGVSQSSTFTDGLQNRATRSKTSVEHNVNDVLEDDDIEDF